jgi:hypothetical protein
MDGAGCARTSQWRSRALAAFAVHRMRVAPPLPAEAQGSYVSPAVLQLGPRVEPELDAEPARPGP